MTWSEGHGFESLRRQILSPGKILITFAYILALSVKHEISACERCSLSLFPLYMLGMNSDVKKFRLKKVLKALPIRFSLAEASSIFPINDGFNLEQSYWCFKDVFIRVDGTPRVNSVWEFSFKT